MSSPFSILVKVVDGKVTYAQFLEDSYAAASSLRKSGSGVVQTERGAEPFQMSAFAWRVLRAVRSPTSSSRSGVTHTQRSRSSDDTTESTQSPRPLGGRPCSLVAGHRRTAPTNRRSARAGRDADRRARRDRCTAVRRCGVQLWCFAALQGLGRHRHHRPANGRQRRARRRGHARSSRDRARRQHWSGTPRERWDHATARTRRHVPRHRPSWTSGALLQVTSGIPSSVLATGVGLRVGCVT